MEDILAILNIKLQQQHNTTEILMKFTKEMI